LLNINWFSRAKIENFIERHELQNEIQSLKDEINRLKGEKGKRKYSSKVHKEDKDISTSQLQAQRRRKDGVHYAFLTG